ncbi:MAG: endonuclease III [Prevotella sp.]|nr:endonuclease III [Prevotella sp.]
MTRKERYEYVLNYFREHTGNVSTELQFGSVFQLLVAVVLSAQCTDKRVNQITPELFRRFPDAKTLAAADEAEVYECVKSVSYPNAKAAHIVAMARELIERFGGEVPACFDSLVSLTGVGRKTANVIMAVAFGEAKMPVDTHVFRVSHRLGLVSKTDNTPLKVERKLVKYIPEQDVAHAHHWLLLHGRYVCTSRAPHCAKCDLADICPKIMEGSKLNA